MLAFLENEKKTDDFFKKVSNGKFLAIRCLVFLLYRVKSALICNNCAICNDFSAKEMFSRSKAFEYSSELEFSNPLI